MLVQAIIEAMVKEIDRRGFSVLEEYPNMIEKTDRQYLESNVKPGSKFAWVLTDYSSDFVQLGFSETDNDMIEFFGDTPGEVYFYRLDITGLNSFHLYEIDKKTFNRLPVMHPITRRTVIDCANGQLVMRTIEHGPVRVSLSFAPSVQTVCTNAPEGCALDAMSMAKRLLKQ